ncbi:MAG: hypothetical protein ORN51_00175 [Akkermansiaceae bacterium]|nr:hypothetical protein [Akkermansiaceae bacterium]
MMPVQPPRPSPVFAKRNVPTRKKRSGGPWGSVIIGVILVCAVFVVHEKSKRPRDQQVVVISAPTVPAAPPLEPTQTAAVEPPSFTPEPSPTPPEATTPTPPVALEKPTPTASDVTESDRINQEANLVLKDLDAQRPNAIQRDKELMQRTIDGKAWSSYRKLLTRSIDAAGANGNPRDGANRFRAYWSEPVLYQAFLRWQILGRLSESVLTAQVADRYSAEMMMWICTHNEAMEEILLTIKPEDDCGQVVKFLSEAWANSSDRMDKYFPLALACAVVFDREISIPNPLASSSSPERQVLGMQRFLWFIEKNESGLLAAPVHHSSARDLVWVVCAPVATSELEWALHQLHMTRKNWGNTYGMVEYLMKRAVEGLNPYKEYSLAEILKEGGICGDQSYFAANTARAQGIPAMIFTGVTDLGGHAWVGLKIKADEWTTGVGRVGGASKGETEDPQTGERLTEQDVQLWSERAHQSKVNSLAVMRHLWLADYFVAIGKDDERIQVVRLANQVGPSFTETWSELYEDFQKQMKLTGTPAKPSNLDDWKWFAKAMRHEFKDNPRMAKLAADAETTYIFPYCDGGDATKALGRERRRIERDSSEQKDLIAESLKRQADLIQKQGGPRASEDIGNLYDSALRKYGSSITAFEMMAQDYFSYFKDDSERSHKVVRDIELAFKRIAQDDPGDYFRTKTEASICSMICELYRQTKDEERAVMLEKRYKILMARAARGAL